MTNYTNNEIIEDMVQHFLWLETKGRIGKRSKVKECNFSKKELSRIVKITYTIFQREVNYKKEVITVLDHNKVVLGFITRRDVLYGIAQELDPHWFATKSLVSPKWVGAFSKRKDAKLYLESLR